MDEFIDPLRDPRFPNRPQHPDFWRIVEIILENDTPHDVDSALMDIVDFRSLLYVAQMRAMGQSTSRDETLERAAFFADGFVTGAKFTQRGGHRPDDTGSTPGKES